LSYSKWTAAEKRALAKDVVDAFLSRDVTLPEWIRKDWGYASNKKLSMLTFLRSGYGHSRRAAARSLTASRNSASNKTLLEAIRPLAQAAANGRALTPAQVKEVADACAKAIPAGIAGNVVDELKERL
jgi:hypothetical protein